MQPRAILHDNLSRILCSDNVYFSPPQSLKMTYPCIRYELVNIPTDAADNLNYMVHGRYTVTVIDQNPDSLIPTRLMAQLPYCQLDRVYRSNNLTHFVFTVYC